MQTLTGAEIVVECLKEQGVDTVFGKRHGTELWSGCGQLVCPCAVHDLSMRFSMMECRLSMLSTLV